MIGYTDYSSLGYPSHFDYESPIIEAEYNVWDGSLDEDHPDYIEEIPVIVEIAEGDDDVIGAIKNGDYRLADEQLTAGEQARLHARIKNALAHNNLEVEEA